MGLFCWFDVFAVDPSTDGCRQDDEDGRYSHEPDEQGTTDGYPAVDPRDLGTLGEVENPDFAMDCKIPIYGSCMPNETQGVRIAIGA